VKLGCAALCNSDRRTRLCCQLVSVEARPCVHLRILLTSNASLGARWAPQVVSLGVPVSTIGRAPFPSSGHPRWAPQKQRHAGPTEEEEAGGVGGAAAPPELSG
jgi:hypothetical protein